MSKIVLLLILSFIGTGVAAAETINLTILEAKRIALQNNRDIEIERKTVEISEGEVMRQKGVFDPVFNLSPSYTNSTTPTTSTFITNGAINTKEFNVETNVAGNLPTGTYYDFFNFSLSRSETDSPVDTLSPSWFTTLNFTLGQELLRNFGYDVNMTPITVARRSNEISVRELEKRVSDILLNVETAYWNMVAAKKNLENTRSALNLATDLQRRNEIQVDVGVLPSVVVTQAKAEVAARQVDVIQAENALKAEEDNLKNILAIPLTNVVVPVDEPTIVIKKFDESRALEEALANRAEVAQAKLDIKNKETLKRYYSNQRLPRLAIQGTVDLQGLGGKENPNRRNFGDGDDPPQPISDKFDDSYRDSFRNLFTGEFPTWQLLAIFSYPIFNWTARGDYIKATADLDRSDITYTQVVESVALDVRNAIREVENSIRRIDAAKVSVQLAQEVVGNEGERLKVGIGTTREVLEAQRDLVDARNQQIRAIADYNIALAQLERARGTIIQVSGIMIDTKPYYSGQK